VNAGLYINAPLFLGNRQLRLVFFGGKGGVGKTTCAAAAALRLAMFSSESSFLLVSTDPAHSLGDSLAKLATPHNLVILELDARKSLATFKEDHHEKLREIASRGTFFDEEDIGRILDLSLPGMDELMAFLEISKWVEEKSYDCIVVDTAPTGHTLRLLAMPELIKRWLEALDALLAKHRYMKKLFSGSYQRDALDEFLLGLAGSVKQMEALLRDPQRCCFVPVMLAEALSVSETLRLLGELKRSKIPVSDIVVNRLYLESNCRVCTERLTHQKRNLSELTKRISGYSLWGIPRYPQEIRGSGPLEMFWEGLFPLENPTAAPGTVLDSNPASAGQFSGKGGGEAGPLKSYWRPVVDGEGNLPAAEKRLLVFAGKGGVGKTTLACATALRMAKARTNKEVFLFSTDPAHSLSDCLGKQIGPEPTCLAPGLTAMEIDAQAEFEALKEQYAEELGRFLGAISPNLDLTFDRDVMERVMDLSPPGLDEVMALTVCMGFLAQDRYHVFVLDSAPTGHLIRLLETPELIEQWLKLIFNLFLKYKRVLRIPGITRRLVQISKDVKQLRTLLADKDRAALFAVTILTEMAYEETKDLVDACKRMRINVPMLFLNLATPAGECPLCSAFFRSETKVRGKFGRTFSEKPQTLVYDMGEPRGLQRLTELGEALYH
jgi:arsenite-transporting ATPase